MNSNSIYNTKREFSSLFLNILRELLLFKSTGRLFHILRRELDGKYCNEHILRIIKSEFVAIPLKNFNHVADPPKTDSN